MELKMEKPSVVSKKTQMSLEASSMFPGFRFSPTDVELISYYLKKKIEGAEKCVEVIKELDISQNEPWDLPAKAIVQSDNEWFFFSTCGRKYPNGLQSKRATKLGYWKATGRERNVKSGSEVIGSKRTLVFHLGRAPKGERTEWLMHEYRMLGTTQDTLVVCRLKRNQEFQRSATGSKEVLDKIGASEGYGVGESSKKISSSHDSHSVEQLDSTSESDFKLSIDATAAETLTPRKDLKDEDDFYADILNDNIVNLDETSWSRAEQLLPVAPNRHLPQVPSDLTISQAVSQALSLRALPYQGTANRRINSNNQIHDDKDREEHPKEHPRCLADVLSAKLGTRPSVSLALAMFFGILAVLALLVVLFGSRQFKRITNAVLYRDS